MVSTEMKKWMKMRFAHKGRMLDWDTCVEKICFAWIAQTAEDYPAVLSSDMLDNYLFQMLPFKMSLARFFVGTTHKRFCSFQFSLVIFEASVIGCLKQRSLQKRKLRHVIVILATDSEFSRHAQNVSVNFACNSQRRRKQDAIGHSRSLDIY